LSIAAVKSLRLAATQSPSPLASSALSLEASSVISLIALTNLSRSLEHHDDTMNSTYCTFSPS